MRWLLLTLGLAWPVGCVRTERLALSADVPAQAPSVLETEMAAQEVCVGSSIASAGELSEILYYRAAVLPDGKVAVGYFAIFSEERPWGNNWLTWTVLPALAIDMVYSRALFVVPGLQRAMYGKADVEGFRIVYRRTESGRLEVDHGVADDGLHTPRRIDARELLALDPLRPTLYTTVWSHQLGGAGVRRLADLHMRRCYRGPALRPLPDAVSAEFRIDRRAPPAHVERLVPREHVAGLRSSAR